MPNVNCFKFKNSQPYTFYFETQWQRNEKVFKFKKRKKYLNNFKTSVSLLFSSPNKRVKVINLFYFLQNVLTNIVKASESPLAMHQVDTGL